MLLRYFSEPNLVRDIKWWLKHAKRGEAPNHDTPVLVSRHYTTFQYEGVANETIKVPAVLLQNFVLFCMNVYISLGVCRRYTVLLLVTMSLSFFLNVKNLARMTLVWYPAIRDHITNQRRRVEYGDIENTVPELKKMGRNPLYRLLSCVCWKRMRWGPLPTACISLEVDGQEKIALLYKEGNGTTTAHTVKYCREGMDLQEMINVRINSEANTLTRTDVDALEAIHFKILREPKF